MGGSPEGYCFPHSEVAHPTRQNKPGL